jgi:hypothetical protein
MTQERVEYPRTRVAVTAPVVDLVAGAPDELPDQYAIIAYSPRRCSR